MGIGLIYKDTVQIVKPVLAADGYATESIGQIETVPALFISNTGYSHVSHQDAIDSDAEIYVDPTHWFVEQNFNRLEGMMVIAPRFGSSDEESWYRIITVRVGEDKLLGNTIDNVLVFLKKAVEIPYVS